MKRGFIRGLWGIHEKSHRILQRRFRTDTDIQNILKCKYNEPFVTYIFGKDNYKALSSLGFNCKLILDEPQAFDLVKYQFRNKLEMIKYALYNDGYDELVYLDWDCVPIKPLSSNFWEELGKKQPFQACLQQYHRKKCHWRPDELRKVPNGGFIYMREKTLMDEACKLWEETGKNDTDEIAFAKMTDNMIGGWKGKEEYWKNFEPMFVNLHRDSPYDTELLKTKDVCFIHYQGPSRIRK